MGAFTECGDRAREPDDNKSDRANDESAQSTYYPHRIHEELNKRARTMSRFLVHPPRNLFRGERRSDGMNERWLFVQQKVAANDMQSATTMAGELGFEPRQYESES